MLFRYIIKNMLRSSVTNVLFCFLLTLAGALLSLSAGLWYSVLVSERTLEATITTIAVPDIHAIRRYARNYVSSNKITEYETAYGNVSLRDYGDYFQYYVASDMLSKTLNTISENVYSSGQLQMDDRRVYGAWVQGLESAPLRLSEQSQYNQYIVEAPQFSAAFVVTCDRTEKVYNIVYDGNEYRIIRATVAFFNIEEDVFRHAARFETRSMTGYFPYSNADGSIPVEVGKRYLITGNRFAQYGTTSIINPISFPSWYNSIPLINIPNGLYIDVLSANKSIIDVDTVHSFDSLHPDLVRSLQNWYGFDESSFPLSIGAQVPEFDSDIGCEGFTWFELDGSLEKAHDSQHGNAIDIALGVVEKTYNSLMVMTTNNPNSLLRFNQRTVRMADGRPFSDSEIKNGAQVCLISEQLAQENSLNVGDTLPLQIYPTHLSQSEIGNASIWLPVAYDPRTPISDPQMFKIVGIYRGPSQEMNDHAIYLNTVIIPSSSYSQQEYTLEGAWRVRNQYYPPVLDTIIVPNGEINETRTVIDSLTEGYSRFFRFYDQGYSSLKPVLANLRTGMTWILTLAFVGWGVAAVMFSLFYVNRKKHDTAMLEAIGVRKARRFRWVFVQCAAVIIIAQCIILGVTTQVYSEVLDSVVSASESFTGSYRDYTLSEMDESGGLQLTLPLDRTTLGLILTSTGQTIALLATAWCLSLTAAKSRSLAAWKEDG